MVLLCSSLGGTSKILILILIKGIVPLSQSGGREACRSAHHCTGDQGPARWPIHSQMGAPAGVGGFSAGVAKEVFIAQKLELSPERRMESPLEDEG